MVRFLWVLLWLISCDAFAATENTNLAASFETVSPPAVIVSVPSFPSFGNVLVNAGGGVVELFTNGDCNAISNTVCQGNSQPGVIEIEANPGNAGLLNLDSLQADQNDWALAGGQVSLNVGPQAANPGIEPLTTTPVSFGSGNLGTCPPALAPGDQCFIFIGGSLAGVSTTGGFYQTSPIVLTLTYTEPP